MRTALLGHGKGGLYRQVVFICRWSLGQVRPYAENTKVHSVSLEAKRSNWLLF